jgi:hypothetical protein
MDSAARLARSPTCTRTSPRSSPRCASMSARVLASRGWPGKEAVRSTSKEAPVLLGVGVRAALAFAWRWTARFLAPHVGHLAAPPQEHAAPVGRGPSTNAASASASRSGVSPGSLTTGLAWTRPDATEERRACRKSGTPARAPLADSPPAGPTASARPGLARLSLSRRAAQVARTASPLAHLNRRRRAE